MLDKYYVITFAFKLNKIYMISQSAYRYVFMYRNNFHDQHSIF